MSVIIDALNIRKGGGEVLLNYFVNELQKKNIKFTLLTNNSVSLLKELNKDFISRFEMKNYFSRSKILKEYLTNEGDILFCFGNFPPVFRKKNIKVFTFFQNFTLLPNYKFTNESIREKFALIFKRFYIGIFLKNTDYLIFQTQNISQKFIEGFNANPKNCLVIPFYDTEKIQSIKNQCINEKLIKKVDDFIFVSHPNPHKNFNLLLDAWDLLLSKNIKPRLYLTIPSEINNNNGLLLNKIENFKNRGGNIINLGNLPFDEIIKKTYQCGYSIFPSLSESFGLGLIESYYMGLKIIASDLPYVHAVVQPSLIFNPNSAQSIALAVELALSTILPVPKLLVKNQIEDLIQLLKT